MSGKPAPSHEPSDGDVLGLFASDDDDDGAYPSSAKNLPIASKPVSSEDENLTGVSFANLRPSSDGDVLNLFESDGEPPSAVQGDRTPPARTKPPPSKVSSAEPHDGWPRRRKGTTPPTTRARTRGPSKFVYERNHYAADKEQYEGYDSGLDEFIASDSHSDSSSTEKNRGGEREPAARRQVKRSIAEEKSEESEVASDEDVIILPKKVRSFEVPDDEEVVGDSPLQSPKKPKRLKRKRSAESDNEGEPVRMLDGPASRTRRGLSRRLVSRQQLASERRAALLSRKKTGEFDEFDDSYSDMLYCYTSGSESLESFVVSDTELRDEKSEERFDCICGVSKLVRHYNGRKLRCKVSTCGRRVHATCFNIGPSDQAKGFICHKCNPMKNDKAGNDIFEVMLTALKGRDVNAATSLLDKSGRSLVQHTYPLQHGRTVLHIACAMGLEKLVHPAMRKMAEPDLLTQDIEGRTPLHLAVLFSPSCVQKIDEYTKSWDTSDRKGMITAIDNSGYSPLQYCFMQTSTQKDFNKADETAKVLLAWALQCGCANDPGTFLSTNGENLLHLACHYGNFSATLSLEAAFGADAMAKLAATVNSNNALPIHYASACTFSLRTEASLRCVERILEYLSHSSQRRQLEQFLYTTDGHDGTGFTSLLYAVGANLPWNEEDELEPTLPFFYSSAETEMTTSTASFIEKPSDSGVADGENQSTSTVCLRAVRLLLESGASPFSKDVEGVTALHFAALNGLELVVEELLNRRVPATISDKHGWTPLLYAHMSEKYDGTVSDECLFKLLNAAPDQLNDLATWQNEEKFSAVGSNLLKSLATKPLTYKFLNRLLRSHPERYYDLFDCLRSNPEILDFENKKAFFRRSMYSNNPSYGRRDLVVQRGNELITAYHSLRRSSSLSSLYPRFMDEKGSGPGVTREFWERMGQEIVNPARGLFRFPTDAAGDPNLKEPMFFAEDLIPCSYKENGVHKEEDGVRVAAFAGRMVALAILANEMMPSLGVLSPVVFKILLGLKDDRSITYEDFEFIDSSLFKNWDWLMKSPVPDDLGLTFSVDGIQNGMLVSRRLNKLISPDEPVTDVTKASYVRLCAEDRIRLVHGKLLDFRNGFREAIGNEVDIFKPSELELLLCGYPTLDVDEWKRATVFTAFSELPEGFKDWFWEIVENDMFESDRVLLLQFATGRSRMGLTGAGWGFQINVMDLGQATLPTASTCFNLLKLSTYKSKQLLREKLFLAIRYGSGFEYS